MITRYPYHAGYHDFDLEHWHARRLRFQDQFLAVCYAYGISYHQAVAEFGSEDVNTCIQQQIEFIQKNKTRDPGHVLEIGAGRGQVACVLKKLCTKVTAVDVAIDINKWSARTGRQYFGDDFQAPVIVESNIDDLDLDFSELDTILLIETLEHIWQQDFEKTWNKVTQNFQGLFIVTNLLNQHPIPIGGAWPDAELQHCRLIDDDLFDTMSDMAKTVLYRLKSHLVLEF